MKRYLGIALAALTAILGTTACGSRRPVLHVYTWADYFDMDVVRQFEREFGCRVRIDNFASNEELYAKLRAGATGYDVIFPTTYMVHLMRRENMLIPLDREQLPNLVHLDPKFRAISADPDNAYSVPYMFGTTGLGWRTDRVPEDFEASWTVFANPEFRGRMSMLADMREAMGAALKTLGYSLNSTDPGELAAAGELLKAWKPQLARYDSEGYRNSLASAELVVVQGYSGDIIMIREDDEVEEVRYAVPREGGSLWADEMAIPAGARQVELAHAFINFFHRPEIAAQNMEYNYYHCPNTAAYELLDDDFLSDPVIFFLLHGDPELLAKCEFIEDLGEANALYTRIWDEVRAAR